MKYLSILINILKGKRSFNEISKDLVFYSALGVIDKITPFLILNIAVFFFKDSELGVYTLLLIIFTLILPLMSIEVNRFVESIYFNEKKHLYYQKRNELLGVLFILGITISPLIYIFISGYIDSFFLFSLMVISVFPFKIKEIFTTELRCGRDKKTITKISIITSLLRLIGFILISINEETRTGFYLILTFLIPINIVGFYIFFNKKNNFAIKFSNCKNLKKILIFCLPFVPYTFSGVLQNQLDKIFLTNQTSLSMLGIYAILFSFGMPLKFLSNSFTQAWTPHFLDNSKNYNFNSLKRNYFILFLIFIIIYYFIVKFILDKYYPIKVSEHHIILIPLFIGFYFRSIKQIEIPNFIKLNKTSKLLYEFFITLLCSVSFSYLFIMKFELGIVGASIVFSLNQLVSLLTLSIIRKWHLS
jgi:O-antigen/teichoic acid export membrane protein